MPDSETRPLALTRVKPRGSRRGTAAARVTPYALDETSTPSAAAKTSAEPLVIDDASAQQRNARTAMVAPIAQRRPCANRSRNGPISGATIANGSIVSPRNSATWSRASPDGTWKNRLPASEIATAASPAVLKTCSWISRCRPDSPAPSASEARRAWTTVNLLARAVPRPSERSPRPVAFVPVASPRPTLRARSAAETDGGATGTPCGCSSLQRCGSSATTPSCRVKGTTSDTARRQRRPCGTLAAARSLERRPACLRARVTPIAPPGRRWHPPRVARRALPQPDTNPADG